MKTFLETIGKDITGATTLEEALIKGDINFSAKSGPTSYKSDDREILIPSLKTIFRDDREDETGYLGTVGKDYGVIQNREAFAIAEALIGSDMEFKRAGQVFGQTFIILKGEKTFLLTEEVDNYIVIRNSFDGTSRLQISWVPVVNSKGKIYFLGTNHNRVFSLKHSPAWIKQYGKTFVETMVSDGNKALELYAKSMLDINYTPSQLTKVLDQFIPLKYDENGNPKDKANLKVMEQRTYFATLLGGTDLAQYSGTAYQVYRALQELETTSFQATRVISPSRNEFKKVKKLFSEDRNLSQLNKIMGL